MLSPWSSPTGVTRSPTTDSRARSLLLGLHGGPYSYGSVGGHGRSQGAGRHDPSAITGEPDRGSYVALYWVLDGYFDTWNRWALRQVNALHTAGRMFQSATTCTR